MHIRRRESTSRHKIRITRMHKIFKLWKKILPNNIDRQIQQKKIVDEKSTYNKAKFLETLEEKMGFKIHTIQVDNGYEFVNDKEKVERESI